MDIHIQIYFFFQEKKYRRCFKKVSFCFMERPEFEKDFIDEKDKLSYFYIVQDEIRQSLQRVRMMRLFDLGEI